MSSWWQKKLLRYGLRYALARTGLLDDKVLDLDSLDISIGKQNVVELKDVGLNIKQITKLAQLPPCLRLETARVLSLRLTIPADFYQSSIVVEVDGVDLVLHLHEDDSTVKSPKSQPPQRNRSPTSTRAPQHRKTSRRIPSPPPYDPGGLSDSDDSVHLPTAQEVARSFLREEPIQERRELEASVAANTTNVEESFVSESSEGGEVGTGTGIGVPGFLAGFLQGIVDRFKLSVKNVSLRIETSVGSDSIQSMPLALQIKVGNARIDSVNADAEGHNEQRRTITLQDISFVLMSESTALADLSELPTQSASRFGSKASAQSSSDEMTEERGPMASSQQSAILSDRAGASTVAETMEPVTMEPTLPELSPSPTLSSKIKAAMMTEDDEQFADAGEQFSSPEVAQSAELDIRPGDDNISWGSRRSQASGPVEEDLWRSMVSEDDLPESLIIEPKRVPTPGALSSRGTSPEVQRRRRPVSPYDRGYESPGSWPRMHQSLDRFRDVADHTSEPALQQGSVSSAAQSGHASFTSENAMHNLRNTVEDMPRDETTADVSPGSETPMDDNMMESTMFSHDEAESIYMSAIGSPSLPMPGGWGSDRTPSPEPAPTSGSDRIASLDGMVASSEQRDDLSGHATPRARTPDMPGIRHLSLPRDASWTSKELVQIESFSVSIPTAKPNGDEGIVQEQHALPNRSSHNAGLPGTFSAYSEMSSSRLRGAGSIYGDTNSINLADSQQIPASVAEDSQITVILGTVKAQLDISSGRLLHALSQRAISPFGLTETTGSGKSAKVNPSPTKGPSPAISASIGDFEISLRAQIGERLAEKNWQPDALTIQCGGASVTSTGDSSVRLQKFAVLLGGKEFLSLEHDLNDLQTSQNHATDSPVLALNVTKRFGVNRRLVTNVVAQAAHLHLHADLTVIEETSGSFGGLSGILDLSNSLLSESGASSPVVQKASKGVRFAGESEEATTEPEIKFNGRFAGVRAVLQGPKCSVQLKTTTAKAVYREHGVVATIEHIILSGPYMASQENYAPLSVDLTSLRIEYLLTPQDKDLERLLSLLTPSKDRYDNDDDILIETLLRQRRKGSLLRTVLGGVKVRIDDFDRTSELTDLSDDLSKLSAVTKYLPEDDRPGLLSLVRVANLEARVPVNGRFGKLRLSAQDLHLAHVGLPPLLAFSVGDVSASKVDDNTSLLHALLPLAGADNSPAVMARMLGDEEEPTIKIKLFNICAEYSVPVILALTDMDKVKDPNELVNDMAQSIADLALAGTPPKLSRSPESDMSKMATKRTIVDLLIHDSAIALTPRQLPSKALVVLSDVHLSTKVPAEETMSAKIELRKASIYLTDGGAPSEEQPIPQRTLTPGQRVGAVLSSQGYVSVGTMMAVSVGFSASDNAEGMGKSIEVDLKNELFLLETCADSTFTLMATLGDLAPPTPPSTDPKYLTQPMPIEDMINSFTGEAVPKPEPQPAPQLIFDAEQAERDYDDAVSEMPLDASITPSMLGEDADELLAESAMAGSLYGPISGVFDMEGEGDDRSTIGEDYPETAESLLEDDPFEMTIAPDERLGDAALMRDLARQCKPAVEDTPVDLGLYEVEDLGYDTAIGGPQALSSPHRFNAPYVNARRQAKGKQLQNLPFRLRVRDFSVIWHLHDGYDWQRTRDQFTEAVERVEQKAEERRARRRVSRLEQDEEESVIGDFLFNSIYIGVPTGQDAQDLRRQINRNIDEDVSETASMPVSGISRPTTYSASGQPRARQRRRLKVGRSKSHKISFDLKGVSADVLVYPPGNGEMVNSVEIRLKEFEIYDRVPTSTWRKFLTHMTNDPNDREMAKPMFHIQLDNVKTLESHAASEFLLHVAVLPLRLHVDQDALDFITRFFEFKDVSLVLPDQPEGEKPFIQRVEVETVDLCLDYKPKKIDYIGLRSGKTTEFMNIITLEGANIRLKHLIQYGVKGFDKLHPVLNDLWMSDVKRTQLPTILAGLAPVRSLVNLGSGVKDVVAIPMREYKKDGRIVRSIQKGAFHFGKTTTSELARLGAKVALGTQTLLSNAEEMLSPADVTGRQSVSRRISGEGWADVAHVSDEEDSERRPAVSAYASQPLGLLSGLKSARRYLEHDLLTARDALIAVQGEFLDSRGPGDLAGAVARHAPTVILRPVIGATRAVGTTLLGVGNQIDRGHLRKVDDKYKRR